MPQRLARCRGEFVQFARSNGRLARPPRIARQARGRYIGPMTSSATRDFEVAVGPHRSELRQYCYRLLGSLAEAEDAVQEALLGAFRGFAGFEGRSSFRSWLYQIATHVCFRVLEQRRARVLPWERGSATSPEEREALRTVCGTDRPVDSEPLWLEPYPDADGKSYEQRESLELAFIAALQHLPPNQRAALILCEVLEFSATEVASLLDTSVAAVNSALQRARESVKGRVPPISQQAELKRLGEARERALVQAFMQAWNASDVSALVALLTEDAKFSMPPLAAWFDGRDAIAAFFAEQVFARAWRVTPTHANGQLAFVCRQGPDFGVSSLNVLTLRGDRVSAMTGFLEPAVHRLFLAEG
jgi:RNA polymerase sigma-70 factor (TIGR02960 family)